MPALPEPTDAPEDPTPPAPVLPHLPAPKALFAESLDDPAQAEELERQQDA